MAHLEIGQRLGDRNHPECAQAIFAEVGANLYLAHVREALSEISETPA